MTLVAVGVSHQRAPLDVRERVHLDGITLRATLSPLVRHAGLGGAVCLSTCNRTEFYLTARGPDQAEQAVRRFRRYLVPGPDGDRFVQARLGEPALTHVFRVASGLESMVVGEAQILGQLKRAHRLAHEAGSLDPDLDLVMRRAVTCAKRVRTATGIGRRAVGIAQAAVEEAGRHRDLRGARVLVVGAGQIGAGVARLLRSAGAGRMWVVERGPRSRALAASVHGTVLARGALEEAGGAEGVDLVVCATTQSAAVLGRAAVAALQRPPGRPLLVLDLAVPRDVDPGARGLAGLELIDLDDLAAALRRNTAHRHRQQPQAMALIADAVRATLAELEARRAAPAIRRLVERTEAVRRAELGRTLRRLGPVSDAERAQLERLTRALAAKLVHAPIRYLRQNAADPARTASALTVLGLGGPDPG